MKILSFTFEAPSKYYGGGIGIIQSLASLGAFSTLDYIGPFFEKKEFPNIKVNNCLFLKDNNNAVVKAINLFRGVTTRYYQEWKKSLKKINVDDYDAIFIDFTYNDFILKWAHKRGKKVIVRVHNIESDMSYNSAHGKTHDKYWFRNLMNGKIIKKREAFTMKNADALIFLTQDDLNRGIELYGNLIKSNSFIVPVCMDVSKQSGLTENNKTDKYFLSTGSLYYGPNAEGIIWLIENVWSKAINLEKFKDYRLVIAGRNPGESLKKLCKKEYRIDLIDSPEDMSPYFNNASLYLAPVFSGAGMKVKVAEALSYGLVVIGSHHALIGYEEAVPYVVEANTGDEFINRIMGNIDTSNKFKCKERYEELYTLKRSQEAFRNIIENVKKQKEGV